MTAAGGRTLRAAGCALLVLVWTTGAQAAEPPPAAEDGRALLHAILDGAHAVVGEPVSVRQLDAHGYAATLRITDRLDPGAPQGSVRIGWEELASARPPRFAAGTPVLVALEPLPPGSLWTQRFPTRDAFAVARRGAAFVREPDAATVSALRRLAALEPDARASAAGIAALAEIVAHGERGVAWGALDALDAIPGLASPLDDAAIRTLAGALGDPQRPEALRAGVLGLVGRRKLVPLRAVVESLASPGTPLEGAALDALAALDGSLDPERTLRGLESPDPRVRAVAVREAAARGDVRPAERLLVSDPAPEVRAAAVRALVAVRGLDATEVAARGLRDPDPRVRTAAGQALARLGDAIAPTLGRLAARAHGQEAAPYLATLALAGEGGVEALRRIAVEHDDPEVRRLAAFFLGGDPHGGH